MGQSRFRIVLTFLIGSGAAAASAARADEVILKDGSRVLGEVLHMVGGKLTVKTVFAKDVEIDWAQVSSLRTEKPLPFVHKDETIITGPAVAGPPGSLAVRAGGLPQPVELKPDEIIAINPPEVPAIIYKGSISLGSTITDGNTQTRAAAATGEFEARSKRQRFGLRGIWNYAEDDEGITARNARGNIKYDFFVKNRFYLFAGALFENDEFQDIQLRTAVSAGPGYQIIDKGDFERPILKEMQLLGEAGFSYFNEDFESSPDNGYVAARWSIKFDWPIIPKKVTFFHFHEGFPSLEDAGDIYITTEQGIRFTFWQNFFTALQINWRWDNTPAPGRERSDTVYLFNVGWNFEIAGES